VGGVYGLTCKSNVLCCRHDRFDPCPRLLCSVRSHRLIHRHHHHHHSRTPLHTHTTVRPVVTLSYAQTLDGCLAWAGRHAADISCPQSLAMTHALRAAHDCILVGSGTLQQDNPRLNVRLPGRAWWWLGRKKGRRDPRPVLLISALPASEVEVKMEEEGDSAAWRWLWGRPQQAKRAPPLPFDPTRVRLARPPIVFTPDLPQLVCRLGGEAAVAALEAQGWAFVECGAAAEAGGAKQSQSQSRRCDVRDCLRVLRARFGCRSVMVEGGARVLTACLRAGVVDAVCVTVALAMMAPGTGYRAVQGQGGPPSRKEEEEEGKEREGRRRRRWLVRFQRGDWEAVRVGGDVVLVGAVCTGGGRG
jgi:riboflavin biosynthesis pyrimidine reductase